LLSRLVLLCAARPPAVIDALSLHDALPIYRFEVEQVGADRDDPGGHDEREVGRRERRCRVVQPANHQPRSPVSRPGMLMAGKARDRKSTRLNSSHVKISYAGFCLKKKNTNK